MSALRLRAFSVPARSVDSHSVHLHSARTLCVVAAALIMLGGCTATTTTRPSAPPSPVPAEESTLEGELVVYAAASLTGSFESIAAAFSKVNPAVTVTFNFGGSPALAEGIVSGAPVDVFASANASTMTTVRVRGTSFAMSTGPGSRRPNSTACSARTPVVGSCSPPTSRRRR